jgi:hypothetical protein
LYRLRLQVENQVRLPDASEPGTGRPAIGPAEGVPVAAAGWIDRLLAAGVVGLLVADLAAWIGDRRSR